MNHLTQELWISFSTLVGILFVAQSAFATDYFCPDGEIARQAFQSEDAKNWPNYSDGLASRVQRQHPQTALMAQAKFIDWDERSVGLCQYYNHVGLVFTFAFSDASKKETGDESFWRREWTESFPEQDKPGQEMMEVCMERSGNLETMSVRCGFDLPERYEVEDKRQ